MLISRPLFLIISLALIIGGIFYLSSYGGSPAGRQDTSTAFNIPATPDSFPYELTAPSAFMNSSPFTLAESVGKQVILVDFWTYSCINCQRTIPYLNAWYEKYHTKGLLMVGVHTPEFEFEKVQSNVKAAVQKFGIKYPVVMDNDYGTWRAYGNRYWPHKYLFDIQGNLVYDHIGEGDYDATEKKIQQLLAERAEVLGIPLDMPQNMAAQKIPEINLSHVQSPEIYFGASRNDRLGNGPPTLKLRRVNEAVFTIPPTIQLNTLYLGGTWHIGDESAINTSKDARIIFKFNAKEVYMVASSQAGVHAKVLLDGKIPALNTNDVNKGNVFFKEDRLYHLITVPAGDAHTLEIKLNDPGLRAFTFTFG